MEVDANTQPKPELRKRERECVCLLVRVSERSDSPTMVGICYLYPRGTLCGLQAPT